MCQALTAEMTVVSLLLLASVFPKLSLPTPSTEQEAWFAATQIAAIQMTSMLTRHSSLHFGDLNHLKQHALNDALQTKACLISSGLLLQTVDSLMTCNQGVPFVLTSWLQYVSYSF